jgi:hypothetical protein
MLPSKPNDFCFAIVQEIDNDPSGIMQLTRQTLGNLSYNTTVSRQCCGQKSELCVGLTSDLQGRKLFGPMSKKNDLYINF